MTEFPRLVDPIRQEEDRRLRRRLFVVAMLVVFFYLAGGVLCYHTSRASRGGPSPIGEVDAGLGAGVSALVGLGRSHSAPPGADSRGPSLEVPR